MSERSMSPTPPSLMDAVEQLWRLPSPGPKNIFTAAQFLDLRVVCEQLYPYAGRNESMSFALHFALRSFGLPCGLPQDKQHRALSWSDAASRLDQAFRTTRTTRIHFCPLDCADTLPLLTFGAASIRRFTSSELETALNFPELLRRYPRWQAESTRFSSFTWLVVEEEVLLSGKPEQRTTPVLFEGMDRDFGAIVPHRTQFPAAVETALFAVLLAPWEDLVQYMDLDWRAFRIPWVYSIDGDVFAQRATPPSPDTLNWEPCVYVDRYGEEIEDARPVTLLLSEQAAATLPLWINDECWSVTATAKESLIFGMPIVHFLNRAFTSSGIDEFLAHILVIEAALGTKADHDRRQPKIVGSRQGATARVATRLAGLLADKACVEVFMRLFNTRSEFLHGRTVQVIPGTERVLARQIARRVAVELVKISAREPRLPREDFLKRLLDAGQAV